LEEIVRKEGAVPATIMLMDGKVHIGISKKELEVLASPTSKVQHYKAILVNPNN
jgi:pseudouridine-5'-phosphate glycosidase